MVQTHFNSLSSKMQPRIQYRELKDPAALQGTAGPGVEEGRLWQRAWEVLTVLMELVMFTC